MKNICLIGQGGHSKVVKDIISSTQEYKLVAYIDDKYTELEKRAGITCLPLSMIDQLIYLYPDLFFLIAIGDNQARLRIENKLSLEEKRYAIIIHPSAIVSPSATINYGTVVMPNAVINADSNIGKHCIINTAAIIEHDNRIGDFVHISPNATLTGNVEIDNGAHIGAGATIIPKIKIGSWTMVGAGSTVINSVDDFLKVAGTPARPI